MTPPSVHESPLHSRREFLRRAGLVAGAASFAGPLARMGMAEAATRSPRATKDLEPVSVQLNWITDATWSGSYIARAKGYYAAQGLDVNLITGGPNVDFMAPLSDGHVLLNFASFTEPTTLNQQGNHFMLIGTMFQKNPEGIISLAKNPIKVPTDLYGKRLGVGASGLPLWQGFCAAAKLDATKVKVVPLQSSAAPLVAGQCDAVLGYVTEDPVTLSLQGIKPYSFLLQDFGYGYFVDTYTVRRQDLDDAKKRDLMVRFLKADLQGQLEMIKNPHLAGTLTAQLYGKSLGLDAKTQIGTAKAMAPLFYSPTAQAKCIGYMGGTALSTSVKTINAVDHSHYNSEATGFVTNELLDEILTADPMFGKLPALSMLS